MKRFAFVFVAFLVLFLQSCGVWSGLVSLDTNIPFFYETSFEVINTSDYDLEVGISGRQGVFRTETGERITKLLPGQSGVVFFKNYSTYAAEASVSLKAWGRKEKKLVGAAARRTYIDYLYQRAEVWIVSNETFKNAYAYGYR